MKRGVLIAIIIFAVLATDFLCLLGFQSTAFQDKLYQTEEQINTLEFLKDNEPLKVNYSKVEISHLEDVKSLMTKMNYYFIGVTILIILSLLYIYKKDKKQIYKPFLYGGIVSFAALMAMLLWILIDFTSIFDIFHRVLFQDGTYIFDSTAILPKIFPVSFFFNISKEIFTKTVISSVIFIALGFALKKKRKKK
jgi:integral membrane protein (TIGR01906 family)